MWVSKISYPKAIANFYYFIEEWSHLLKNSSKLYTLFSTLLSSEEFIQISLSNICIVLHCVTTKFFSTIPGGHLGYFKPFAIANTAPTSRFVYTTFHIFGSAPLWYILAVKSLAQRKKCISNFARYCQILFHSTHILWHCYQQCMKEICFPTALPTEYVDNLKFPPLQKYCQEILSHVVLTFIALKVFSYISGPLDFFVLFSFLFKCEPAVLISCTLFYKVVEHFLLPLETFSIRAIHILNRLLDVVIGNSDINLIFVPL